MNSMEMSAKIKVDTDLDLHCISNQAINTIHSEAAFLR